MILIELQATGPNNKYVAMQYWNDVFSAIRAATARGITVVEAAGNGNENFNLPILPGHRPPAGLGRHRRWRRSCHQRTTSITSGTNGASRATARSGYPAPGSGSRTMAGLVNVQAWGWHVTTLGYGDAQGGANENRWYTLRFSGTSSASPIVTGALACMQGRARARTGAPLTPARVRRIPDADRDAASGRSRGAALAAHRTAAQSAPSVQAHLDGSERCNPPRWRRAAARAQRRCGGHLVVTLRAGWTFESARRVFRSAEGQTFDPKPALPARTRIEYRTPTLADRPQAELSPAERDLARYLQLNPPHQGRGGSLSGQRA